MPIPRRNEKEDEYISRCMGNDTMVTDFPENNQRAAMCYSNWRRTKNVIRRSENLSQSTAYSNTTLQESDT